MLDKEKRKQKKWSSFSKQESDDFRPRRLQRKKKEKYQLRDQWMLEEDNFENVNF